MIITQTPLRISFLGGGTDYPEYFQSHGGAVLGSAVDKSCYFTAAPFQSRMFDYRLRVAYRKVECVSRIDEIEHTPFRECLRWTGLTRDATSFLADIELPSAELDTPAYGYFAQLGFRRPYVRTHWTRH